MPDREFGGGWNAEIGDTLPARDTGDPVRVYTTGFTWTWLWTAALALGSSIYLLLLGSTIVVLTRNRLVGASLADSLDS